MAFKSCCGYPLRDGCMIIGILTVVGDFHSMGNSINGSSKTLVTYGVILRIIDLISSGILIGGVAKQNRFYLLPWILVNILCTIWLWIGVFILMFANSFAVAWFLSQMEINVNVGSTNEISADELSAAVSFLAIIIAIAAVIQMLLIKVVIDYFMELRVEEHRAPATTCASDFISV